MRILITSSIYPTPASPKIVGGAEIFARRFAESLLEKGDAVEVVRAASESGQAMEKCNGVDVYSAPVENIYFPHARQQSAPLRGIWHAIEDWQRTSALVAERIERFKPDCLHSNNLSGLTTAIWRSSSALNVPIVHTLHDYYLTCPRCSRFLAGHSCGKTCMSCEILTINRRHAAKRVNAVVGVSQRILDIHTELGLFAETPLRTVIRNASTADVSLEPDLRRDKTVTLGFIGRLTEEKGIYNLAQAVAAVPNDLVRLLIAGHASEGEQQRIRSIAPGANIEFLGFVTPADFYNRVDVVVVPSIWEDPSPLVVADAQAAGKPLLGTHFGGIPEAIEHGVTGWLTAPEPEALRQSILRIVADPQGMAEICVRLRNGVQKWTFSDVVDRYRDVFERARREG